MIWSIRVGFSSHRSPMSFMKPSFSRPFTKFFSQLTNWGPLGDGDLAKRLPSDPTVALAHCHFRYGVKLLAFWVPLKSTRQQPMSSGEWLDGKSCLFLYPALLLKADLELVGNFLGGLLGPTLNLGAPGKLPVALNTSLNSEPDRVVRD